MKNLKKKSSYFKENKYKKFLKFIFAFVSTNWVEKYINEINCNKSSSGSIRAKIIKIVKEVIVPITNCK